MSNAKWARLVAFGAIGATLAVNGLPFNTPGYWCVIALAIGIQVTSEMAGREAK